MRSFAQFTLNGQTKILRCAQNDSESAQNESIAEIFCNLLKGPRPSKVMARNSGWYLADGRADASARFRIAARGARRAKPATPGRNSPSEVFDAGNRSTHEAECLRRDL